MQKTFATSDKLQKTASTHLKRYSEHDFKTNPIDKLLITQTSLNPQSKIRIIKTKLPSINSFAPTVFNSHNYKISKAFIAVEEMTGAIREFADNLQTIRLDFCEKRRNLQEKLQKIQNGLKSKIQRFSKMVEYRAKEDSQRSQKIKTESFFLKQKTKLIKEQINKASLKMRDIELMMGVYTGQDKYII